jgi:hypothetical protein
MKTNLETKVSIGFLTAIAIVFVLAVFSQNISGQKQDNPAKENGNKPKVDIKVNKETDKDGNITRYDSTYSWSWSSDGNTPENVDSVFNSMRSHFFRNSIFNDSLFLSMPLDLKVPFYNDSTLDSYFESDFFNNGFGNMEKLFREHNKLMEKYFHHEPLLKVPDNKETLPSDKNGESAKPSEQNKIKTEKISGVEI